MRLDSTRERRPTAGFGWVDHRVVRDGHLAAVSQGAIAVYLMLCVVADRRGISYYSTARLGELVKHQASRVEAALQELLERGLIARQDRFVQVSPLELVGRAPEPVGTCPGAGAGAARSQQPAPRKACPEPEAPEVILARFAATEQARLIERARQKLRMFAGAREPARSVVLAIAASLAREESGS